MKKRLIVSFIVVVSKVSLALTVSTPIIPQAGQDIICSGPNYTYQHDVRHHGVDNNLTISGDAALVVESDNVYSSYYTDRTKGGSPAVYQYTFVAESGAVFGDVSVASRANIFSLACSIAGEYKIGDRAWTNFLTLTTTGETRPIDFFENIHSDHFSIRYRVDWIDAYYSEHVQLFRSTNPQLNQPGDFAFTFEASLVTDANCHKANLIGDNIFIDLADFATMANDYEQTGNDLLGDIDGNGTCDIADLQWLAMYWLCDCYN